MHVHFYCSFNLFLFKLKKFHLKYPFTTHKLTYFKNSRDSFLLDKCSNKLTYLNILFNETFTFVKTY